MYHKLKSPHVQLLNPYSPNATFLYPLKTSENLRFSEVFRGYRNVTLGEYGLNSLSLVFHIVYDTLILREKSKIIVA